jgi:histone H3/H4
VNAPEEAFYKRCSTCKDPIAFDADYFLCSVSACNRKRTPMFFCSLSCWDAHQADARHRDAGAEKAKAPSRTAWFRELAAAREKQAASDEKSAPELVRVSGSISREILIVGLKFKDYIRTRSSMNTSDGVVTVLSSHLRDVLDRAIEAAGKDGRKTVMDRDVLPLVSRGVESRATGAVDADDKPDEILIVVSKMKDYVKARAAMNTSDSIAKLLSAYLRRLCRQAIRKAATDDRKTVLDRDFAALVSS